MKKSKYKCSHTTTIPKNRSYYYEEIVSSSRRNLHKSKSKTTTSHSHSHHYRPLSYLVSHSNVLEYKKHQQEENKIEDLPYARMY